MTRNNLVMWKFASHEIANYTLVIPSVAVGNVGQLTCDLLISSLEMKKIGSLYSLALIPVIGYNPYNLDSDELCNSCEIYKSDCRKLIVLQFRSPIIHRYAKNFLQGIVSKFKELKIKDCVILSSSFAHEKKHIMTSPFRYIISALHPYSDKIKALNWNEHESVGGSLKIYGGGFASLLYTLCIEETVPCIIIYKYCSEGDNIPDAYEMLNYMTNIVPLYNEKLDISSQVKQPVSWNLLFGRPPPKDIY